MNESGIRSGQKTAAAAMGLLRLVRETDASARRMERACLAINNEAGRLLRQTGINNPGRFFNEAVSVNRMGSHSEDAAGISTGNEMNRKAVTGYEAQPNTRFGLAAFPPGTLITGYAAQSKTRSGEMKMNRGQPEDTVKTLTFLVNNPNIITSKADRIAAMTGTQSARRNIVTEARAAETKKPGGQTRMLFEAAGDFDIFADGLRTLTQIKKFRAAQADGRGFYNSGLMPHDCGRGGFTQVSGRSGIPAMINGAVHEAMINAIGAVGAAMEKGIGAVGAELVKGSGAVGAELVKGSGAAGAEIAKGIGTAGADMVKGSGAAGAGMVKGISAAAGIAWVKNIGAARADMAKGISAADAAIAKNSKTAGAVKAADREDIRWMRKLADRDYVVQAAYHTLAPNIKVEFSGPITKEADVDEVISHLGAMMREQIAAAPEGVYE